MEERLRGSEQRLRGIIENAQSGYFFVDRDGIYRQVNDAWLRMHKYDSPDEIVGRHYSATQVDADLGKAQDIVRGLMAGDPVPTGEFSRLCKDGSIGYHTFSASPVFSDHEVIGLEGFLTDTTGHKKTLDELRASEGRFRSIFDNSLDAIQLGLPTGEIISANRAAQSLLGMTEEELRRAGRDGIVVQDEALATAIQEREKTGKWRGTLTFRRKDGSTFPADVSSNIFGAQEGRALTIAIFRDITERMWLEEELRLSVGKYREIFENVPIGLYQVSPDGRFIRANVHAARILGYDSPEELMDTISDIATQIYMDPSKRNEAIRLLGENGNIENFEVECRHKNGSPVWVSFNAKVIRDGQGNILYHEGVSQDITERKLAEDDLRVYGEILQRMAGVVLIRARDGVMVYTNPRFERMFGYEPGELPGRHVSVINAPWDGSPAEVARRIMEELEKTGQWSGEVPNIRKDGSAFWCHAQVSTFDHHIHGPVWISSQEDITERKKLQEDLRLSEKKYRAIFDNVPIGVFQSSPEGRYISVNVQAARNLGYDSPEELIGAITDIGTQVYRNPEDRLEMSRLLKEQGHVEDFECQFIRKDGSTVWGSLNAKTVRDERGEILYYEGTNQDINARKLAEASLRESERRYRDMLSNVELLSLTLDWGGRVTFCNDYLLRLTGWRREEVLGSNWFELFIPPGQGEELKQAFAELLNDLPASWHRENEILTRSGERRLIRWNNTVLHSISGDVIGTASIGEDITDRKKAEEGVRFLSQVVEQSTDSIICSDAEFRIVYMNSAAEKLFGWPKEELLGKTPEVLNAEPAVDDIQREIYASVLAGKAYLGEALNRRKDGSTFFCQFLVSPLYDVDGRLMGCIGSQRDVTDRRKAQDELATHRERLEDLVKERTKELEDKTQILEELNAATRALLRQREEDRRELEERFVTNMKNLILPYAEKMKRTPLDERQTSYLGIMETHFNEIMSPLMRTMQQSNFTPKEAQIASLIKDGKTTKDIAEIMGIATSSIDTHRKSIRKKLGLSNAKVNLQSHLRSMG